MSDHLANPRSVIGNEDLMSPFAVITSTTSRELSTFPDWQSY